MYKNYLIFVTYLFLHSCIMKTNTFFSPYEWLLFVLIADNCNPCFTIHNAHENFKYLLTLEMQNDINLHPWCGYTYAKLLLDLPLDWHRMAYHLELTQIQWCWLLLFQLCHHERRKDHYCRGAMDNKELCLWCRRGLLAYVYSGVFVWMNALVAGTALI